MTTSTPPGFRHIIVEQLNAASDALTQQQKNQQVRAMLDGASISVVTIPRTYPTTGAQLHVPGIHVPSTYNFRVAIARIKATAGPDKFLLSIDNEPAVLCEDAEALCAAVTSALVSQAMK